jgi:hypothetical protein
LWCQSLVSMVQAARVLLYGPGESWCIFDP